MPLRLRREARAERQAPVIAAAPEQRNGLAFRPARVVFINQSGSLGLIHVLDAYLRRWPIGHSPARGTRRAAIQVPRGRALCANGHADRDFECVPVWHFGNSRARAEQGTDRSPIARSDSATIYFLGALGRRRCRNRTPGPPPFSSMNSTPAASKVRRTAKSLATVREVLSSASSARLIVLSPSDDARARSFALHLRRARAARIWELLNPLTAIFP